MEPGAHGLLGRSAPPPVEEEQGHEHTCVTALVRSMVARNAQESPRTLIPATNRTALWVCHFLFTYSHSLTLFSCVSAGPNLGHPLVPIAEPLLNLLPQLSLVVEIKLAAVKTLCCLFRCPFLCWLYITINTIKHKGKDSAKMY